MAKSDELKAERSKYYSLKDSVSSVSRKISAGTTKLSGISGKVASVYSVNEQRGDDKFLNKILDDANKTQDSIHGKIMPEINEKIRVLDVLIEQAEREEELARQRAEALARQKEREKNEAK